MEQSVDLSDEELSQRLLAAAGQTRFRNVAIRQLERLPKGLSSLTYRAALDADGQEQRVIVKAARPGIPPTRNRDVLRQARIMTALASATPEVPVPEVLIVDRGDPPAVPPLFAMTLVPGDAEDPGWPEDAAQPDDVVRERGLVMARTLAALHAVPAQSLLPGELELSLTDELDRWADVYEAVDTELAAPAAACRHLLDKTLPTRVPAVLNHGDYRFGNAVFDGTRLTGLIDWEIAALEDPRFDLANLILYCGPDSLLRLRDSCYAHTSEELIAAYELAIGARVVDLDWFVRALRYKSAAALALLIKHSRRGREPSPLLEEVAERLPAFMVRSLE